MRAAAKGLAESALVHLGIARISRILRGGQTLILAYHNVVPDEDARAHPHTLHLPLSHFLGHLDFLQANTEVISLEKLGTSPAKGSRPRVALTFDDCYVGAMELAAGELNRRGLPGTFFVCPGLLSSDAFWWDLYDAAGDGTTVFQELGGKQERILEWYASQPTAQLTPSNWRRPAPLSALQRAVEGNSHLRLASHSWTHPNLGLLTGYDLRFQLEEPRKWLLDHFDQSSDWFASPYGFSSPELRQMASQVGYSGVLEIAGDWVPPTGWDRWRTPRLSIPHGVSSLGFQLRISGIVRE